MNRLISTKKAYGPSDVDGRKTEGSRWVLVATFVVPAVLVIGALFLLITYQGGIETAVTNLGLLLPLGYAFAAGMVASVNPCGIMMLSSYTFYQLKSEGASSSAARRVLRALVVAVVITSGFIVIFAAVGSIITAGGRWLVTFFPYAGLVIGGAMILLGVWLLVTRKTIGIPSTALRRGSGQGSGHRLGGKPMAINPQRSLGNAFLFGLVYAVGSLSCTLPIFLAVVGGVLAGEGLLFSFGQFVVYALGMGLVIFVVTTGAALFKRAMARWLRLLTPHMHRLSTMFMIGAGLYLIYYWVFQGGLL